MLTRSFGPLVLAFAIVVSQVSMRVEALAPPSACPQIWSFFRVGKLNDYVLSMRAGNATSADLAVTLVAGKRTLTADLPATPISTPTAARLVPFRSTAILLPEATDERRSDVVVRFTGSWASCPAEAASYDADAKPMYSGIGDEPTGAYADVRRALRAESLTVLPVDLKLQASVDPPCTAADIDASAPHPIQPTYPEIAKSENLTVIATIVVDLDDRGAVRDADVFHTSGTPVLDEAVRRAALRTAYTPAIIACAQTGGAYLFRASFSSQ